MIELDWNDSIKVSPLLTFRVSCLGGFIDRFTFLFKCNRGYAIEVYSDQINPYDISRHFNEVSLMFPQKLTTQVFETKKEAQEFISLWIKHNYQRIKDFEQKYWLLLEND